MSWAHFGNDGGDYLSAILTRGVPHPTGYPTYILLNLIFQLLPISTPYWRGAFFSASAAALSSALLYVWLYRQLENHGPALRSSLIAGLASLAWAFSPFLFAQAVIVDVHSLHAVFVILGLFWISALDRSVKTNPDLVYSGMLAFLFGLGLGNHITLVVMLPAVVFVAVKSFPRNVDGKRLILQFGLLLAGMLVYLYLPWSASHNPAVNWGNPRTMAGFAWLVSGVAYRGMLLNVPLADLPSRLVLATHQLAGQFGFLGLILGVVGMISLDLFRKNIRLSLIWCAGVYSLFALTYAAPDWTTYLLPLLIVWCAWIAAGLFALWSWRPSRLPLGSLAALLFGALLILQLPSTMREGDPRSDRGILTYVQDLFVQAPPGAIILTSSDLDSFPLWYYHLGLKQRPDLHVIVSPLTVFGWYRATIHEIYPDLAIPPSDPPDSTAWETLLTQANPGFPVCLTTASLPPASDVHFTCNP
jgi:hypothetical protein